MIEAVKEDGRILKEEKIVWMKKEESLNRSEYKMGRFVEGIKAHSGHPSAKMVFFDISLIFVSFFTL